MPIDYKIQRASEDGLGNVFGVARFYMGEIASKQEGDGRTVQRYRRSSLLKDLTFSIKGTVRDLVTFLNARLKTDQEIAMRGDPIAAQK